MDINDYRKAIDSIDRQLVEKLEERMRVAEKIAKYKEEQGLPIIDYSRERALLDKIGELSSPDMAVYNRLMFSTIMEMSKDHQRKVSQTESPLVEEIERAIEETPKVFPKQATVACQGVMGAYSQEAADKFFEMPRIMFMKNFEGVFAAIENGLCKYGVLPIENSSAGSVNRVYDLCMEYDFYIVKSLKLKIDHSLLAKKGTKLENIREIYSHEQALAQCEDFLKNLPDVKINVCENTAQAAKMVAESDRTDVAALASYNCGKLYGLQCIREAVQDRDNNYTRFICISKKLEIYPGADKTSLMMVIDHRPGSLYNVLSRFYSMGINLVKLESRPIPSREFEFMFYFDIECSAYGPEFVRLMNQLDEMSREFKYLGSYLEC